MRTEIQLPTGFLAGLAAGVAAAAVAIVAVDAWRRRQARRQQSAATERADHIDGVRPPNEAELDARPAEEANAIEHPLESEALDYSPMSQRW